MSFYTCEQCEAQYGYNEREPDKFRGMLFCSLECLYQYLRRVKK